MCGIAGICSPSPRTDINARLFPAGEVISHRGPDGEGTYVDPHCGLLHKRLSIIDLSSGGQPIFNESSDLVIVFNGEIYNYRELKQELEKTHRFSTVSDTETILHQFEEGVDTLSRLRGMFAFAIWDKREKAAFLMRDRVGIKPLYYALTDDGTLVFGSEIKAILATGLVKAEPDKNSIKEYLNFKFTTGGRTFFKNISYLEPGHSLLWRDGKIRISQYWKPVFDHLSYNRNKLQEEFEAQLAESIRYHLVSDVPVGAFLSGGLDSSAIVQLATGSLNAPIKTYTCGTEGEVKGDFYYSDIVARRFKSEHTEFVHTPQQFAQFMKKCIWHLDEPGGGSTAIHGYYIAKRAREDVKVLLSGEGADEVLAGHYHHWISHFRGLPFLARCSQYPKWKQWGGIAARAPEETLFPKPETVTDIFTGRHVSPVFRDGSIYRTDFFRGSADFDPVEIVSPLLSEVGHLPVMTQLMYLDLKTYLYRILHIYDRMCMAVSLENRVPFLDHKFLEFCFTIPPKDLLSGLHSKSLLRKSLKADLGQEVAYRPKAGFSLPVDRWFRGELSGQIASVLEDFKKRGIFESSFIDELWQSFLVGKGDREDIWRLVSLEFWFQCFIDEA